MIPKAKILDAATAQELQAATVEKDYVLGWLLYAISIHPRLSKWIFKGGTCLKKCFFETYRFSEDLDFTIPESEALDDDSVVSGLHEIAEWVETQTGIQFPREGIEVGRDKSRPSKRAAQAKMTYSGPLQMPRRQQQRVKFDLTQEEIVVDQTDLREIHHGYVDRLNPAPTVACYSVNEILAEKTRATYERQGRARDVYDLVHLSRNFRESIDRQKASDVLRQKFAFKNLPVPTVELIVDAVDPDVLRANWQQQLAHQLPQLPPVDGFLNELSDAIAWWFDPSLAAPALKALPGKAGDVPVQRQHFPQAVRVPQRRLGGGSRVRRATIGGAFGFSAMNRIRYAARNRLLVEIEYKGDLRIVEPYSLRLRGTGNTLLYVREVTKNGSLTDDIRSYKVDEIESARVTERSFTPRYYIEL